jgi:hypothetical protein
MKKSVYMNDDGGTGKMKKVILTLSVLGLIALMGCISEPPTPPPVVIQRPADLAAESIFNSYITDPTGQSRPVIVGIVRNIGESPSVGNRAVTLIATSIVNGAPITEQLASSVITNLPPGGTFQITGNLPQSLNPTTQYTLSVSPGDINASNDTFILNSATVQRYY